MQDKICVVGLGYVGLPLAVAFAEQFQVIGFDINSKRIAELENGVDGTKEVESSALQAVQGSLTFSSEISQCESANIYIITVPTPIDSSNRPDLNPLIQASRAVGKVLKKDDLVIYESTVYPGVTEDVCVNELEQVSGLRFNQDFYGGYSPERINPGDKNNTFKTILKVTSGSTPEVAKRVDELYQKVVTAGTYLASSIKVAEAAKVIENTQRDVNIALINELALIFHEMGIDTREVIEAASTKWNFIKLFPGLVGGHCIGVDPYYLTFKAEELGYKPNLILSSRQINNGMAKYIAEQTVKQMIDNALVIKGAKVLIMGFAFKENCPDVRNTKVVDMVTALQEYGVQVSVCDPEVERSDLDRSGNFNVVENPLENNEKYAAVILAVAHNQFRAYSQEDFERLCETSENQKPVLIDVKDVIPSPTWRL
ncbi:MULTISPECIES: nucleotide sugar dehydrogenase [Gammaproteobacteria]|uniref:nucleotide sugar dehydrogenase n=1 Tax=Gammaproteobacteria TaxID=1236 RepID=UPI000DD046A7|nr:MULTISPECIES: nucleotide sugar dehydrogenase [Gammaproteobacteria]RTE86261.1 nucleotide sugar dehydrogenase [Aliidiomarina sp. B3213]TCZ91612.1 nucleotide sugar dehydrogenase [Lysobacter sp. N42]